MHLHEHNLMLCFVRLLSWSCKCQKDSLVQTDSRLMLNIQENSNAASSKELWPERKTRRVSWRSQKTARDKCIHVRMPLQRFYDKVKPLTGRKLWSRLMNDEPPKTGVNDGALIDKKNLLLIIFLKTTSSLQKIDKMVRSQVDQYEVNQSTYTKEHKWNQSSAQNMDYFSSMRRRPWMQEQASAALHLLLW